ncbi:MAG: ATP-binding protein [Bryobacteraceae bacterium]
MRVRSLGVRLACLFSLLLLAGLISLGTALWFGVEYNMVSAVDRLMAERAANLEKFVDTEFGNVLIGSPSDRNRGEFRGKIEQVDPRREWIALRGTRVRLNADTKFEGSLRVSAIETGQFAEVEVERDSADSAWEARTVAVVMDLPMELKEMLGEYALATPDGRFIAVRNNANGDVLLPAPRGSDWTTPVPWQNRASGFITIQTANGEYRTHHRDLSLLGGSYRLQLSSSLAVVSATRRDLVRSLLWAVPATIVLSLAGGYLLSRAALRPLQKFAGVASRITAKQLSERLEVPETGDVISQLAVTFNSMLDRLETSVKRLDEFTADASHELRGPVSVIRTTAELALRQGRAGAELKQDLQEIQTEAIRLTELTEDLLTLARSGSARYTPQMPVVDLAPIIREVVTQRCKMAGPRVEADVEDGDCHLPGDAPSLRRLLHILVDNALRHNPADTMVVVSLAREGGCRVLAVADNGRGIPEQELPRLFDRFYRGDPSRNRSNGTGLGLAIAKWIAECHGGQITVSSRVGYGSTFRVRLSGPQ